MLAKRKLPQKLAQPKVNQSPKVRGNSNLNDSRTVVSGGGNAVDSRMNGAKEVVSISSDPDSDEADDDDDDDDDEDDFANESANEQDTKVAGGEDIAMEDADDAIPNDNEENGSPSFGDLVAANAPAPIDVESAFQKPHALIYPQGNQIQPPSGTSLGTVLTQALRTNDIILLESCLQTVDVQVVRATIQRLESTLAGILLQKLAERLHRKPGRSGTLMVWVQWTLVTHGGFLATQPDLIKKLSSLSRVIQERATGLQPLLLLKGKLDMLEAQIELRKNMRSQRLGVDEDEEDEGVIYVEGQESDEDEEGLGDLKPQRLARNGDLEDILDEGSVVSNEIPTLDGAIIDSEDESSDADNLIDDEAEETDEDTGDEDEVDHDDHDSEDEESDDAPPPSKLQRISGGISKKRQG